MILLRCILPEVGKSWASLSGAEKSSPQKYEKKSRKNITPIRMTTSATTTTPNPTLGSPTQPHPSRHLLNVEWDAEVRGAWTCGCARGCCRGRCIDAVVCQGLTRRALCHIKSISSQSAECSLLSVAQNVALKPMWLVECSLSRAQTWCRGCCQCWRWQVWAMPHAVAAAAVAPKQPGHCSHRVSGRKGKLRTHGWAESLTVSVSGNQDCRSTHQEAAATGRVQISED